MVGGCRGGPGGGRSPSGVAGGGPSPWQGASSRSDAVIVAELWRSWAGLVGDDHRGDRRGRVRTIAAVWCVGVAGRGGRGARGRLVSGGSGDGRGVVAVGERGLSATIIVGIVGAGCGRSPPSGVAGVGRLRG